MPPLVVDRVRSSRLENRHLVAVVAVRVDAASPSPETGSPEAGSPEIVAMWGDGDRPTHPRSSIKLLQALPLVESGAADAFALSPPELALACASHQGEPDHLDAVRAWLARVDRTVDDLECGVQPGRDGTALGNCCSGKHAGFLTLARHLDIDPTGYIALDHPVQQRVRDAVGRWTGVALAAGPDTAVDGCGIPIFPVSLTALATSAARVGRAMIDAPDAASGRLGRAMVDHPWFVAGTGSLVTEAMAAAGGRLLAKNGADGVYWAAVPDRGIGIAIKCLDGADAAADTALGHVLDHLGLFDHLGVEVERAFAAHRRLTNHAGVHVADLVVA